MAKLTGDIEAYLGAKKIWKPLTGKQAEILRLMRDDGAVFEQCRLYFPNNDMCGKCSRMKSIPVNIKRVKFLLRKKYIKPTWWMTDEITDAGLAALAEWEKKHEPR